MHNPRPGSRTKDAAGDRDSTKNLPSWASSQKDGSVVKKHKGESSKHEMRTHTKAPDKVSPFANLLEGVVFVLSGFVNPERSTLRSQALEMGAEFRPDWSPDCTLLICAFPNTPKARQVAADGGTIVSKEWIIECHNKKKLVEIDPHLMHAGKPWRKPVNSLKARQDAEKQVQDRGKKPGSMKTPSSLVKDKDASSSEDIFPPNELKKWVISDLRNTVSWLESQEEKPAQDEVRKIAAEGIVTCLEDAIEALENNMEICHVMDQWMFIPHVVKELSKLEGGQSKRSLTKKELTELAIYCKGVYKQDLNNLEISPTNNKLKKESDGEGLNKQQVVDDPGTDSDATIVMTDEEIEQALRGH